MNTSLLKIGRWTAELVLVFVGVSAAFWLNSFQQHQQEAKRRDQILAALEEDVQRKVTELNSEVPGQENDLKEFLRKLEGGEMPPLEPLDWATGYSASDTAALLQAGGLDLLEVKTITALRQAERTTRRGLSRMQHYQQWSDQLIVPHLDEPPTFFYDPATKQLRKRFGNYPDILRAGINAVREMAKAYEDLLAQLRVERQRR